MVIQISSNGTATRIPRQRNRNGRISPRKWAKIIGIFLLFLVGVGIGHSQGLKDGSGKLPATVQAQLDWCNSHSKTPCQATMGAKGWQVVSPSDKVVADFNDGFATAKQDDCQQGAKVACAWLKTTKK